MAEEYPSQDFYSVRRNVFYNSSLTPSATASVCSDAASLSSLSSQHSDDTTASSLSDLSYSSDLPSSTCGYAFARQYAQPVSDARRSLRQNPRRTSTTATTRTGCPPPLVRQAERKLNFVDNLVGMSP